jgi:hypothetical protein
VTRRVSVVDAAGTHTHAMTVHGAVAPFAPPSTTP